MTNWTRFYIQEDNRILEDHFGINLCPGCHGGPEDHIIERTRSLGFVKIEIFCEPGICQVSNRDNEAMCLEHDI